jgi:very-short-patch-repair endonuclease
LVESHCGYFLLLDWVLIRAGNDFSPLGKGGWGDFGKPMLSYAGKLKNRSRELRKNMTDAERLLWSRIRGKQLKGCQFYRQKPVGTYIVDFYCPKGNLIIEIDGGQHYTSTGQQRDRVRDNYLNNLGLAVMRFSDREIFENLDGVVQTIWEKL